MENIKIHSKFRNYEVKIGKNLLELLIKNLNPQEKYFIIMDERFAKTWTPIVKRYFPDANIIAIKGGESAKSFETYSAVISELTGSECTKKDTLIAFGGGTICDLTGYVASTYKRGVKFINVPTTTLAMVDASVGGKNAINVNKIKNAVGTIYPPSLVLIGLDILKTLPNREFTNGLFESLKMGIIADKELYQLFKGDYASKLEKIIVKSINVKKEYIEKDEMDKNIRHVLNFGHTFGHAFESISNFKLLHGEAVANGMLIASYKKVYYKELKEILEKMNLPFAKVKGVDEILAYLKNDKKRLKSSYNFVTVDTIGCGKLTRKTITDLERMIKEYGI